ncbi:alpha/beta fold hydrolase, partial [Enterobacter hormaechei]
MYKCQEYPRIVCDTRFGGVRAFLIDLPGSGYSDKRDNYRYRTSEQAQVVVELLNHLGLDSLW